MYKIDTPTSVSVEPPRPVAAPNDYLGFFTGGIPGDPNNPATIVPDWWLNMIQNEMANVVTKAGLIPDKADDTQFSEALDILARGIPTGTVAFTIKQAAPSGYLFMNGETIGNLGSGAVHQNETFNDLYADLYALGDEYAPVTGGRNMSEDPLQDFNVGKPIKLLESTGRALIAAGTGTGLNINHPLGSSMGEETHTLTVGQLASHRHEIDKAAQSYDGNRVAAGPSSFTRNEDTGFTGGNQPHNNMPPVLALNIMIKV